MRSSTLRSTATVGCEGERLTRPTTVKVFVTEGSRKFHYFDAGVPGTSVDVKDREVQPSCPKVTRDGSQKLIADASRVRRWDGGVRRRTRDRRPSTPPGRSRSVRFLEPPAVSGRILLANSSEGTNV